MARQGCRREEREGKKRVCTGQKTEGRGRVFFFSSSARAAAKDEDEMDVLSGFDVLAAHRLLVVEDLAAVEEALLLGRDVSAFLQHLLDPQERVALIDVELELLALHELDHELHVFGGLLVSRGVLCVRCVLVFCVLFSSLKKRSRRKMRDER